MTVHRQLRSARGPGCAQPEPGRLSPRAMRRSVATVTGPKEVNPADHVGLGRSRRHHTVQLRRNRAQINKSVLSLGRDEQHPRTGVGHDHAEVTSRQKRVHRTRHGATSHRAQECSDELDRVQHRQRNTFLGANTVGSQRRRHSLDQAEYLDVGVFGIALPDRDATTVAIVDVSVNEPFAHIEVVVHVIPPDRLALPSHVDRRTMR